MPGMHALEPWGRRPLPDKLNDMGEVMEARPDAVQRTITADAASGVSGVTIQRPENVFFHPLVDSMVNDTRDQVTCNTRLFVTLSGLDRMYVVHGPDMMFGIAEASSKLMDREKGERIAAIETMHWSKPTFTNLKLEVSLSPFKAGEEGTPLIKGKFLTSEGRHIYVRGFSNKKRIEFAAQSNMMPDAILSNPPCSYISLSKNTFQFYLDGSPTPQTQSIAQNADDGLRLNTSLDLVNHMIRSLMNYGHFGRKIFGPMVSRVRKFTLPDLQKLLEPGATVQLTVLEEVPTGKQFFLRPVEVSFISQNGEQFASATFDTAYPENEDVDQEHLLKNLHEQGLQTRSEMVIDLSDLFRELFKKFL